MTVPAPHRCRAVEATGDLATADKPDHTRHARDLRVSASSFRDDFWYLDAVRTRWVVDPCEWDDAYAEGVRRLESAIAACPDTWDREWVLQHTTRCAPAPMSCIVCFLFPRF